MDLVDVRDVEFYEAIQPILLRKLEEGLQKNQLVDVSGLRNIGKSVALVEFAKQKNIPIIVNSKLSKGYYADVLEHTFVYTKSELDNMKGFSSNSVLLDETVDVRDLNLQDLAVINVTGFYSKF